MKVVQLLMDAGADIVVQGGQFASALRAASQKGYERVVRMLIDAGLGVNANEYVHGSNALQTA